MQTYEPRRPGVSLCILCHNGAAEIAATVRSAQADGWTFHEIILLDNGSDDGSAGIARHVCPEIRVLRVPTNLGASAGRNILFRKASSGRILFVDHDVRLTPGCTAQLSKALDQTRSAVAAAPVVLYARDPARIQFGLSEAHFLGAMALPDSGLRRDTTNPTPRPMNSLVSACFLLDVDRWGNALPFHDFLPYIFEDHDFGVRCRVLGHELLGVPSAAVLHGAGTPGLSLQRTGGYVPARIAGTLRHRWALMLLNYQRRTLVLLAPVLLAFEVAQVFFLIKRGWFALWITSIAWIIRRMPEILGRRADIQGQRRNADRDFLTGGAIPFSQQLTTGTVEHLAVRSLSWFCAAYWKLAGSLI